MNGYNPNESMIPASGGPIIAMSGGGGQTIGAGLVFANGGRLVKRDVLVGRKPLRNKKLSDSFQVMKGGKNLQNVLKRGKALQTKSTQHLNVRPLLESVAPKSTPSVQTSLTTINEPSPPIINILKKLMNSDSASKKGNYSEQEQDTILKDLTSLLNSDTEFEIEIK